MAIATTEELLDSLARCHVLEAGQVEAIRRQMQGRLPGPGELARLLVQRGWASVYQLRLVCAGRGQELELGQYILHDLLGEGGMGQVFVARHRRLDRLDALKVIRPEHLALPMALRRFLQEARAAARLSHPNIVSIYDADECKGIHFLAMEYIPGIDLSHLLAAVGPLPAALASHFLRQAALGLQHAHERGLVHRDLKPANLLLAAETSSIKILDMGLARVQRSAELAGAQSEMTQTGSLMGTPDYMAPEQAIDAHQVDIRADIYSLGCTLYALLCGGPPFPTGSVVQKILWHQDRDPPALETLCHHLPAGLPELCHKAMAKDPRDRFQIPADLAAALARFCTPEPAFPPAVQAAARRSPPDSERMDFGFAEPGESRHSRLETVDENLGPSNSRTPFQTPTIDQPTDPFPRGHENARQSAEPSPSPFSQNTVPGKTDAAAPEVLDALPAGMPADVPMALPARAPGSGASRGGSRNDTLKLPGQSSLPGKGRKRRGGKGGKQRQRKGQTLWSIAGSVLLFVLLAGAGWLFKPWPGGQGAPEGRTGNAPGEVRRIDGHTDIIYGVAISPDGKRGASCGKDRTVRVWDLETGTLDARLEGFSGTVNSVAWSPTDELLIVGGQSINGEENRSVRLWDIDAGKAVRQFPLQGHTTSVISVAFSPDGKWALTGGGMRRHGDLALRLWDVDQRSEIGQLAGHEDFVFRVVFAADGQSAASCSNDGTVRVWDIARRKEAHCFHPGGKKRIVSLAFSPDGKLLAGGGEDSSVHIWDLSQQAETASLMGHSRAIFGVAFLPDGKRLLSASADRTLRLWDVSKGQAIERFEGHTDIITNLALSPDGRRALTCSQDRSVRLWQLPP